MKFIFMEEKVIIRGKCLFMIFLCAKLFAFSTIGHAQTTDIRTLAEINAVKNKSVIDYFLLCPDIYFTESVDVAARIVVLNVKREKNTLSETDRANALRFRKGLIKHERLFEGIDLKECTVDVRNGYIKVSGRHYARTFEISFTIFERPGKLPIPALTFHEDASDGAIGHWIFYDITGGQWKPLDETNFLPSFSLNNFKPLVSDKSIVLIPKERIVWKLVLPRFGTTLKIVPDIDFMEMSPDESNQLETLCKPFENYVLECTWSKDGKFGEPLLKFFDPKNQ
jgi:hypothetical protein